MTVNQFKEIDKDPAIYHCKSSRATALNHLAQVVNYFVSTDEQKTNVQEKSIRSVKSTASSFFKKLSVTLKAAIGSPRKHLRGRTTDTTDDQLIPTSYALRQAGLGRPPMYGGPPKVRKDLIASTAPSLRGLRTPSINVIPWKKSTPMEIPLKHREYTCDAILDVLLMEVEARGT
jgi:hypothetical protein